MKRIVVILLVGIISPSFVGLIGCREHELSRTEIAAKAKEFNLPIYKWAKHVKFYNKDKIMYGVTYKAPVYYDSLEVLQFYNSKMYEFGYKPFVEDYYKYADRKWRLFIDATKKGQPYGAQLIADWVNAKRTKRARLVLDYYWYVKPKKSENILYENNDLTVNFQIMPFSILPPPQYNKGK